MIFPDYQRVPVFFDATALANIEVIYRDLAGRAEEIIRQAAVEKRTLAEFYHDNATLIVMPEKTALWDMVNKVSGVNLVVETLRYAFEGEPDEAQRHTQRRYGAMAYMALFQPISPTLIDEKWHGHLPLERVQCSSPTRTGAISNSFERPGFILVGEKNRTALDAALSALTSWIAIQSEL